DHVLVEIGDVERRRTPHVVRSGGKVEFQGRQRSPVGVGQGAGLLDHDASIATAWLSSPPNRSAASRSRTDSDFTLATGIRRTPACTATRRSAASRSDRGTSPSSSRISARLTQPAGSGASFEKSEQNGGTYTF